MENRKYQKNYPREMISLSQMLIKEEPQLLLDIDKYISKAQHQLNDENNYKKLQTDPTLQHNELVNDRVERF